MQIKYKVTYLDGSTVDATAGPADIVEFERRYQTSFLLMAAVTPPVEHIYFLAWAPLKRTGVTTADFDAFVGMIEDVEEVQDVKSPVPTKRSRSGGRSPASPSTPA